MIYLTEHQMHLLIEHSKREVPSEACGILVGQCGGERKVKTVYQMTNTDKSSSTFLMSPKEQLRVMKEIRNLGLQMVGIYHSHPETEAYPSMRDVEFAYYPGVSYVIVSLKDKDNPSMRSFKIEKEKITEEKVCVE